MTLIANPIYDVVFKYLMEDERVAKILLSALLKKEILELEMRKQEYTAMQQTRISLFRMDFAAKIRDNNGEEHLVLSNCKKPGWPQKHFVSANTLVRSISTKRT